MGHKSGLPEAEHTKETCIIVVNVGTVEIGTIVDKVSEVLDIAGDEIEDPPSFEPDSAKSFRDKLLETSFFFTKPPSVTQVDPCAFRYSPRGHWVGI